jgi:hypothetical protein
LDLKENIYLPLEFFDSFTFTIKHGKILDLFNIDLFLLNMQKKII